jgi:hypothetical protein
LFAGSTAVFSIAARDAYNNSVASLDIGSFSAHLLVSGAPALHVSLSEPQESDVRGYLTPYRSSANATVTFNAMENGLAATMYSDSSMQKAVRSCSFKNLDLIEGAMFASDAASLEQHTSYGFRWSGFFKPQEVGVW